MTLGSADVENGTEFTPRFGPDGLITCVTVDAQDGVVLMLAHMNAEALQKTLETGLVHYWSRSRGALWRKGDTSGQSQRLVELRVDDLAGPERSEHAPLRSVRRGRQCRPRRHATTPCKHRPPPREPQSHEPTLVRVHRCGPRPS